MFYRSYNKLLEFLFSQLPMYQRDGKSAFKKDLKNIKRLCKGLGNPHKKFKSIHIAGTNGKGSTAHYIAAALVSQNYKVGLYTSPHYKDFRERIKIGNRLISKKDILDFVNVNIDLIQEIKPSFFEITVAMAFDYFAKQKVDIAIIETGLGGRLDSTNIINPLISVITNISFDHQSMLGDTLVKIAKEKAGIIKSSTPVIIGEKQVEISKIFKKIANTKKSKITYVEDCYYPSFIKKEKNPFVIKNMLTAYCVLKCLQEIDDTFALEEKSVIKGFLNVFELAYFIGRWQVLSKEPLTIADSAHNEAGIEIALSNLSGINFNKLHVVMGFVNDKNVDHILSLFPKDAKYYYAKANIPRGLEAIKLMSKASKYGLGGKSYRSIKQACAAAKMSAKEKDVIIIIGSIFVVAEVL